MKALILGGTGFVGTVVSKAVKDSGVSTVLLERKKEKVSELRKSGFEVFEGSLENSAALGDFLSSGKFDAIINLIGIIKSSQDFSFKKVHVEYVESLLDLAKKSEIARFIHMSAFGASPESDSEYFQTKYEGEILVKNSGLKWTVIKPSLIFGNGAAFFDDMINLVKTKAFVPIIGGGETKFAPIDVVSVAAAFNNSLQNDASIGKAFELCGPDIISFEEIMDLIMKFMPPKKLKIHLPAVIAERTLGFLENISFFKKLPLPVTADQIRMLRHNSVCADGAGDGKDSAAAILELNRTRLSDWLKEYIQQKEYV